MSPALLLPGVLDSAGLKTAIECFPVPLATDAALAPFGLIASRCNTSPRRLEAPAPSAEQLEQIFSAAAAAPDHGLLRPWRFISIGAHQRPALAKTFVLALLERSPGATQEQLEAAAEKAARAPFLALAVFSPNTNITGIRSIEQTISFGCAIQNILLAAHALGFGSGLSSGQAMTSKALRALFKLDVQEEAVCFVAIGCTTRQKPIRLRPRTSEFLFPLTG